METSRTISECLNRIGLRAAGGNYRALAKACAEFGIPIKKGRGDTSRATLMITTPLSEVLIENSGYRNRSFLKKRLLAEGLLQNRCSACGLGPHWNTKPLVLQLEHQNGIYNDHRLGNLCLLCPNCHSQTPTFAGRSLHKTKPSHHARKTRIPWPIDLPAQVAETSKSAVALRLGVSETAVRKRLKRHHRNLTVPS
jgi:hypothetical protein